MSQAKATRKLPVPVTILTGFLGAGKTTLLNHLLHADHGLKVAVLVNDFGAINIDSQLIVDVVGEMVTLSNGCICCTIRGDLLKATLQLLKQDNPPEYIIIETSGVSDPMAVALTFQMPEVMPLIQLDGIITVVDAEQFLELRGVDQWLSVTQIAFADIVVLNKVDLVTDIYLEQIKSRIREITEEARIIEGTHGKVPVGLLIGVGEFAPEKLTEREVHDIHTHGIDEDHHHHHHDHTLIYNTWSWVSDKPLALDRVRTVLEALPKTVYRAKGIFYIAEYPDQRCVFQLVGKRGSMVIHRPWKEGESRENQVVLISSVGGLDAHTLNEMFLRCEIAQVAETQNNFEVVHWVRD